MIVGPLFKLVGLTVIDFVVAELRLEVLVVLVLVTVPVGAVE